MNNVCNKCGSHNFKEGKVGRGQPNFVYENNVSVFTTKFSPLLVTFCLDCGEVQSFRLEHPEAFREKK
ncbi:hypothetical protein [Neobacillus terrae]|uniref:hypothetical protein n=1 Tax=Neobacillus terrae TaxID=3034837 RepID=UPI00140BB86D|nr:hypothetical protein [Neobacillus terrae]NHM33836.1 hypothetical protein [Neobacillus terrae]